MVDDSRFEAATALKVEWRSGGVSVICDGGRWTSFFFLGGKKRTKTSSNRKVSLVVSNLTSYFGGG